MSTVKWLKISPVMPRVSWLQYKDPANLVYFPDNYDTLRHWLASCFSTRSSKSGFFLISADEFDTHCWLASCIWAHNSGLLWMVRQIIFLSGGHLYLASCFFLGYVHAQNSGLSDEQIVFCWTSLSNWPRVLPTHTRTLGWRTNNFLVIHFRVSPFLLE